MQTKKGTVQEGSTMLEAQYPLSGRFLQGRLRHAMTDREKDVLERLIWKTETIEGEKTIVNRGDFL